jgi:ubiquinone biosynthesis protein UbiJ
VGREDAGFRVAGGEAGTTVSDGSEAVDATIAVTSPLVLFALAARQLSPADAVRSGAARVEGDIAAVDVFPDLFDMVRDDPNPQQLGE